VINMLSRASSIMSKVLYDLEEANADIIIRVPSYKYNTVDTSKAKELLNLGLRAARRALPQIKKLLRE